MENEIVETSSEIAQGLWEWLTGLLDAEIYNGTSISDLLTLEAILGILGNTVAAVFILCVARVSRIMSA